MDKLENIIKKLERKRMPGILAHGKGLFRENPLPSHDMGHHLRVWHFAKELVNLFAHDNENTGENFIDGLLVAALFHDMGMAYNRGPDHGKDSRDTCLDYFRTHPSSPPQDFLKILHAIEHHDMKEYVNNPGIKDNPLLLLLSLADDLDAYGIIGFFRYSEIYMLREIPREKMPGLMEKNLDHRFGLLKEKLHFARDFLTRQEQRYLATRNTFALLKTGRLAHLMEVFEHECVHEKHPYTGFVQKIAPGAFNQVEKEVLEQLREEISYSYF